MLCKPKGILFDKDGTLLDYHKTWMPANRAAAHNVSGGDALLADHLLILGGWDRKTDRMGAGSPLAAGDLADIAELWRPHLPEYARQDVAVLMTCLDDVFTSAMQPTPVCDLAPLMDRLAACRISLGVATADSENGLKMSLGPFDILDRFDFAVGFDSGYGRKPDPDMIVGFSNKTGLPVEQIWMIGDNRHDMQMGSAAGAVSVGVLTGTSGEAELLEAGALKVLTSISDLPDLIDQI